MDQKAIKDAMARDLYTAQDYGMTRKDCHELAENMVMAGYRLDSMPNGKAKPELIAIIEAKQAELDRARVLLRLSHDFNVMNTMKGWTPDLARKEHLRREPKCSICTFLTETSTVKP